MFWTILLIVILLPVIALVAKYLIYAGIVFFVAAVGIFQDFTSSGHEAQEKKL